MSLIQEARPKAAALGGARGMDRLDLLAAVLFIAVCAALGALLVPLQVAQFRWEQAARAAFDARQTAASVAVPPLFDFNGHERFINGVAGGLFAVTVELLLLANACSVSRLVKRWVPVRDPGAEVASELRAIRRSVEQLAERRQGPATGAGGDVERLRASAEACFRISRGAVSRYLADELEELGEAFQREADELAGSAAPSEERR